MSIVLPQRMRARLPELVAAVAFTALVMSAQPAFTQTEVAMEELFLRQSRTQTEGLRKKFAACRTETYRFASRAQCVRIDRNALGRTIANDGPSAGPNVRFLPSEFGRPDIFATKLHARSLDRRLTVRGNVWFGSVHSNQKPTDKIGTALFSANAGALVGRITTDKEVFEIRPLEKGLHVIIRADLKKMLPTHPPLTEAGRLSRATPDAPAPAIAADSPTILAACNSETPQAEPMPPEVTVSVVFEDTAMPVTTDLASVALAYIGFTDTSMLNSRAVARVLPAGESYVHTIPAFVNDHLTLRAIIAGSANSPGSIGDVHRWRTADNADVVVIVTNALGACGYADSPKPDDPKHGFVMVSPDCANVRLQVGHEIGHILGGDHENGANVSPRTELYARAHILSALDRHTIMVQTNSVVEPHYSNPDVCWVAAQPSQPTGVAGTENARAISERAAIVSNFMP